MEFHHAHPDVKRLVEHLSCGRCGTPRHLGLMVNVDKLRQREYRITTRCLRCGARGAAVFRPDALEPGEEPDHVPEPISTDQVIDMHVMPDEAFAAAWGRLVTEARA